VAEHGEDAGEGAPEVSGVQRHRDVDGGRARAGRAVAERRRLPELRKLGPGARQGEQEDHGEYAHCGPGVSFGNRKENGNLRARMGGEGGRGDTEEFMRWRETGDRPPDRRQAGTREV
jgi:hypothetical protein